MLCKYNLATTLNRSSLKLGIAHKCQDQENKSSREFAMSLSSLNPVGLIMLQFYMKNNHILYI